jgi:hypothetical protein
MSRSFWIVAGLLVVSVFIITTRVALPTKSTELTEKASVPDGAQGIAGACGTKASVAQFSTFQHNRRLIAVILLPVNELAMNFPPQRVDDGYLKVLVVAEALVAEVLGNFSAMPNRFCICFELDPNCISMRTPSFISKKNFCIAIPLTHQSGVSGFVPNVSLQPILISEQRT